MQQLLLATRNSHKTQEFAEILGDGFIVHDLAESEVPPIEETGLTFEANAILKGVETSKHFPGLVVADDSGLEVDALGGAPGIYSARYAGEHATNEERIAKLLAALRGAATSAARSARFRCALALAQSGAVLGTFDGVVEGVIVSQPRGTGGFGYDPIFQPHGFDQTFGELGAAEKNEISHRARAIRSLLTALRAAP
ncbi:MAG: RdgB/HAM1 family non-canonical purine NTP pyrophosphatase [Verrucomicrobiota bacterium]|nr:RdgB/HAM1 family non-canonical purine NTP pyrophosphatase [Verrucomicrobiota bacterium]